LVGEEKRRAALEQIGGMSSLSRELVFLILQFLDEEKFKDTVHRYNAFIQREFNS
jgi:hypothetical protein